jgi:surface polysaccharide O-acyltransferase-like enzyme
MKSRVFWIDMVKFIAIFMVLLAHMIWLFEQNLELLSESSNEFLTLCRIIASLGVPLFMMVSGVLLFGKRFETPSDILSFYKKGLFPLFVTAEIWIVIFCFINTRPFFHQRTFFVYGFCS